MCRYLQPLFVAILANLSSRNGNLNLERNTRVNFPDFVDWARSNRVGLPVGLSSATATGDAFPFPPSWTGPTDDPSWNRRFVVQDAVLLGELQQMLNRVER